jgi:hypothetical protein
MSSKARTQSRCWQGAPRRLAAATDTRESSAAVPVMARKHCAVPRRARMRQGKEERGRDEGQEQRARAHAEAGAQRRRASAAAADAERRVAAAEQCAQPYAHH